MVRISSIQNRFLIGAFYILSNVLLDLVQSFICIKAVHLLKNVSWEGKGHFCYKHVIYLYKVTVDAYILLFYIVVVNVWCSVLKSSVLYLRSDLVMKRIFTRLSDCVYRIVE